IANPLLDGVSMKGAKGVIISITGGEDMRLMEVDEAASHIKELVDPDANIIWGSAFNNSLDGKIRVSVVATGIEAEASAMPEPARVFAFPGFKKPADAPAATAPAASAAPVAADDTAPELVVEAPEPAEVPTFVDTAVAADDELLLDTGTMLDAEVTGDPLADLDPSPKAGSRWLSAPEPEPAAVKAPTPGGGTLFERMSNIARGSAKVDTAAETSKDPLDIPRFLNRQNNQ
ncbi:MAG: ftsZ, partial [Sphingomonadales bacterium]|nr:ftsZ [Sphingomonadales bacterium]